MLRSKLKFYCNIRKFTSGKFKNFVILMPQNKNAMLFIDASPLRGVHESADDSREAKHVHPENTCSCNTPAIISPVTPANTIMTVSYAAKWPINR
jgi:hypothetical protein